MRKEPLTEQQEQEVFQTAVPEEKRTALLRYLIIMFAVAFVLVLMSMVLQVRSSNATVSQLHQSSTSAMTRVQKLQDDNRALSDRVDVLEQEAAALSAALDEAYAKINALQADNTTALVDRDNLQTTCDALARVLMGPAQEGDVDHSRAVDAIDRMKEYLSPEVAGDFEKWLENNK